MIPLTFEQAVDIYLKAKQLTIGALRLIVDDYADQMELFGSCLILMGDKLVECEDRMAELERVNGQLLEVVRGFQALTPDQLRAQAALREAPPDSVAWVGSSRVFAEHSEQIIEGLVGEITEFFAAKDAQARDAERRHPSSYIDTSATESDEIDPNRD